MVPSKSAALVGSLKPILNALKAKDFSKIDVKLHDYVQSCGRFAVDKNLSQEARLLSANIYRLGLQMRISQEPASLLAFLGHKIDMRNGWISACAFGSKPIRRDNYHIPATRDSKGNLKENSIDMFCMDWKMEITVPKEHYTEMLKRVGKVLAMPEFAGSSFYAPENSDEQSRIIIESNGELIEELYSELDIVLSDGTRPMIETTRVYCDQDGKDIRDLILQKEGPEKGMQILLSLGYDPLSGMRSLKGDGFPFLNREITLVERQRARFTSKDLVMATDLGTELFRTHNEDAAGRIRLDEDREALILADGMGGHEGGEIASRIVVETVIKALKEGAGIIEAIKLANQAVAEKGVELGRFGGQKGIGSTVVVALIDNKKKMVQVAWAGDSRAKFVSLDKEGLLTRDHGLIYDVALELLRSENDINIDLPFGPQELEAIERKIDEKYGDDRKHSNIIVSALGSINVNLDADRNPVYLDEGRTQLAVSTPKIGLVEVPLADDGKTIFLSYSDGLVDGYTNDVEAEKVITDIVRTKLESGSSIKSMADLLVASAAPENAASLSGIKYQITGDEEIIRKPSTDNVTVIAKLLPGLKLDDLVDVSSHAYHNELFEKLKDEKVGVTRGELRHLVLISQLKGDEYIPLEVYARLYKYFENKDPEQLPEDVKGYVDTLGLKQRATTPSVPSAVSRVERREEEDMPTSEMETTPSVIIDEDDAPTVEYRIDRSSPEAAQSVTLNIGRVKGKDLWNAKFIAGRSQLKNNSIHKEILLRIGDALRKGKVDKTFDVYLSSNIDLFEIDEFEKSIDDLVGAIQRAVQDTGWWARKNMIYIYLNDKNVIHVLSEKEAKKKGPDFVQKNFVI